MVIIMTNKLLFGNNFDHYSETGAPGYVRAAGDEDLGRGSCQSQGQEYRLQDKRSGARCTDIEMITAGLDLAGLELECG